MTVLAIDQGTSGTKAAVVDPDGTVLAVVERSLRPVYLDGGGVEQDPMALLDSVLDAGRAAVAQAGVPIAMVSLANQGESVLAWDPATGRPLSPAIVWQDRRAEAVCAELAASAELIAGRTGLVLDPYFSAPKMTWLRRTLTASGVVSTTDAWLLHQLTGEFVTDVSTASRSLVLDVDRVDWDPELLQLFGLADERLPRLVACDEVIGTTTAFGPACPVGGLVVDQQAALFAEDCLTPGMAKCTYGTGAFLLAHSGFHAVRSTGGLTSSVAWRLRNSTEYCVDGQVYTAASAIRWLTDLGLTTGAADIDRAAAAGSGGVLFAPGLAGLAAPWWRPDARGAFLGLSLASRADHLVTAVIEGIAAQIAMLARAVEHDLGQPLTAMRVDGGLTRSSALLQAQADLLQLPVEVYPSTHATALGAAAFGRLALDPALAVADAVGGWQPSATFVPEWSADRAAEFLDRWSTAVATTVELGGTP